MLEADPFVDFCQRLNDLPVNYMVTGSVGAMIYGEPRLTHDLDVVVDLHEDESERFSSAFEKDAFYVPPLEVIQTELSRSSRGHVNIISFISGYKLDVYFPGSDQLIRWGLEKTESIPYNDSTIRVAPPEYVILQKLRFYQEGGSEKHRKDILAMISTSGERINQQEILRWCKTLGLSEVWASIVTI